MRVRADREAQYARIMQAVAGQDLATGPENDAPHTEDTYAPSSNSAPSDIERNDVEGPKDVSTHLPREPLTADVDHANAADAMTVVTFDENSPEFKELPKPAEATEVSYDEWPSLEAAVSDATSEWMNEADTAPSTDDPFTPDPSALEPEDVADATDLAAKTPEQHLQEWAALEVEPPEVEAIEVDLELEL